MSYIKLDPLPPAGPLCSCFSGLYPQPDPYCRMWWFRISSNCETHWPTTDYWVKIRILHNEGMLSFADAD
jgi:hypothetical protein